MTKQIKKKLAVAVGATAVLAAGSMLAVTAATATAAPAAVAQARAAQTAITASAWQIVKEFHGAKVEVSALAGVPGGEPWVFVGNNSPEAFERTGSGWTQMPFPAGYFQVDVAAASAPGNVWAFAEYITRGETQYRALRWDGRSWSVKAEFPLQVGAASVLGPRDVWVFGQVDGQPGNGLGAYHYDGSHWTRVAGPSVQGGSALSDHDVWLGHQTSVGHWDGHAWRRTSLAALLPHGVGILGVLAESPADVYAVADVSYASMVVLRYDGRSWSKVAAGAFGVMAEQVAPMAGDGRGGLWFIGNGSVPGSLLAHYSAGRLATFPATTAAGKAPLMFTIAQAGGEVLAGGYAQDSPFRPRTGLILRYAG